MPVVRRYSGGKDVNGACGMLAGRRAGAAGLTEKGMSAQPECSYCGAKLFPHEVSNDECGTCGRRLTTAEEWTPPTREEAPRVEQALTLPSRPPPEAFATVRQGVAVIRFGVLGGLLIGVATTFVMFAALVSAAGGSAPIYFQHLLALLALFALLAALTVFVGMCFCCAVPRGCEAARWAQWLTPSLIIAGVLTLIVAAEFIVGLTSPRRSEPTWIDCTAGIALLCLLGSCCFAWHCCFQLMASLARLFGNARLARAFGIHLVLTLIALLFGIVAGCAGLAFAAEIHASAAGLLIHKSLVLLVSLAPGAGMMSWLLLLLTRLHRLIPAPDDANWRGGLHFLSRSD